MTVHNTSASLDLGPALDSVECCRAGEIVLEISGEDANRGEPFRAVTPPLRVSSMELTLRCPAHTGKGWEQMVEELRTPNRELARANAALRKIVQSWRQSPEEATGADRP